MDKETIEGFAKYRLNKAKETLETSKMIFKEGKDFTSANNRAYYAIFYAIRAVLAVEEIDFKRHKDVLAYFNKEFVNKISQNENKVLYDFFKTASNYFDEDGYPNDFCIDDVKKYLFHRIINEASDYTNKRIEKYLERSGE